MLRGQLAHLLTTAELPHVDLRVLPAPCPTRPAGSRSGRSHHPDGLALVFGQPTWAVFVDGVKNDRFDPRS
ncbi:MAG: Scr1 family TA system antitoxin-like transcriptional regulator [Pseudonocardiaceae bacterium]